MNPQLRSTGVLAASASAKSTADSVSRDEGLTEDAVDLVPNTQFEHDTTNDSTAARSNRSASTERPDSPLFVSDGDIHSPRSTISDIAEKQDRVTDGVIVIIPPVTRRWDYRLYDEDSVLKEILDEYEDSDGLQYRVRYRSGREAEIPFTQLITLSNGRSLLQNFSNRSDNSSYDSESSGGVMVSTRQHKAPHVRAEGYVDSSKLTLSSEDELLTTRTRNGRPIRKGNLLSNPRLQRRFKSQRAQTISSRSSSKSTSHTSSEKNRLRRSARRRDTRSTRSTATENVNYVEEPPVSDSSIEDSDDSGPLLGKRKRNSLRSAGPRKLRLTNAGFKSAQAPVEGTRRSGRTGRTSGNMRELGEDEIPETVTDKAAVKAVGAKERFAKRPKTDDFRLRHSQTCGTCDVYGDNDEKGRLIYCQGCTFSFHQRCLGPRNAREHLVTKVADQDFILQCRRCVEFVRQKDPNAPKQGMCQVCHKEGDACPPFRGRRSAKQEQKEREENNGDDPITDVAPHLVNNVKNVLFRCNFCFRAFHMHHLEPRSDQRLLLDADDEMLAAENFSEYCQEWSCNDCSTVPGEVDSLVAWRPIDEEEYIPGYSVEMVEEDAKEYLLRWKEMSYFKTTWKPGAWVWGITSSAMRNAFARRDNGTNLPKMRSEDAVPEDYLRVDIVFDIEYTNVVNIHTEAIDKARIKEVKRALVKFKGLGYEDVVWEEPPDPEDTERWADFQSAYNDWVLARYINIPVAHTLKMHLDKVRAQNFQSKVALSAQPGSVTGGKLMKYQMDGVNWLYYQWHKRQNAILADEMGLGKTIQVIGLLATLKQKHNCWPFLIVVPNSTCPNWRREIKQWAPSLRVVTYYGSSRARKLAEKYELFPAGGKVLKCHVVVTSYDAAQDDTFRKVFRGVAWAGLVVDEGQRLKNDKNILYSALNALNAPFKLLLTGTPLQNSPRELFNLLQFLDTSIDAQALEDKYAELTKDNVPELHDLLRPFFLRRTKAQVLTFLPPMAQIILPVTMSPVQKKLYKSILAKNPELIKSIFGREQRTLKQHERHNLNNILMQLRKCLCHPFVYSRDIEERSNNAMLSHRNLVEASSKLQLLEIMLPKLKERGHRVLIFSQFLDMLDMIEDFLDGLSLTYHRLDGNVSSLVKQKRIDEFNAKDSPFFAFLLSTRAGGVGINLASADTVVILDPDFNPHQDIQALSRAHRIGQKNKVLVFQLMTRETAEEKIMQIGKKKMALDHVLIEQMDADDDAGTDLESVLKHGAQALFDDDTTRDIVYDSASVDKLLDRSQIENTKTGNDDSAESQFSFARVWANDKGVLEDSIGDISETEKQVDANVWEKILREREIEVAEEAATRIEVLGRGKRRRQAVDYSRQPQIDSPAKAVSYAEPSDSDTDFQARADTDGDETQDDEPVNPEELGTPQSRPSRSKLGSQQSPTSPHTKSFKRAATMPSHYDAYATPNSTTTNPPCVACNRVHSAGDCPLKLAGYENCNLCGLAHYGKGHGRICPHLRSETQVRIMLEDLKKSSEATELKKEAAQYLRGIKGDLVRRKKVKENLLAQNTIRPNGQGNGVYPNGRGSSEVQINGIGNNLVQANGIGINEAGDYRIGGSGSAPIDLTNGHDSDRENRPAGPTIPPVGNGVIWEEV